MSTSESLGLISAAGDPLATYDTFIRAKQAEAPAVGFEPGPVNELLFPFQRDIVRWAILRGVAAIFAAFGLGKSFMQLEIARLIVAHALAMLADPATRDGWKGRALIVAPLGVRAEFRRDAERLGIELYFVKKTAEVGGPGVYLTNYESVRDGKLDPTLFDSVSLDEASCLRGFGGTKTFREFMAVLAGDDRRDTGSRTVTQGVRYRFVATATPSPNDLIELLAYSAFLDVLDVSTAKTRFFQRDAEHADNLTLHAHKAREFWLWVSSWAVFCTKPSDLSPDYSDEGYVLPELRVHWHEIPTDHRARANADKPGAEKRQRKQLDMFAESARGVSDAAREAHASMDDRVAKMLEIRALSPDEHRIIWHDLEPEREAIEAAVPTAKSVYGRQDLDEREGTIIDFAEGRIAELAAKPVMLGSGCNFQRHCAEAIFLSVSYKFNDTIQAIHRLRRFGQQRVVNIHFIYTEAQREIRRSFEGKWKQHDELVAEMVGLIREFGLARVRVSEAMKSKVDVTRREVSGERFTMVHDDTVPETASMPADSVGLILTSVPFGNQYKYSENYRDFGHTDTAAHFWRQMRYLIPSLYRVLKPGRVAAIHVKDRIVPGGMTGHGFQTVYPFHADAIAEFCAAGFAYMGMVTIVTDVVRENAQTYRLGWSEQCKDATKMGVGLPEYLLLFRKPPTSSENSYADEPVVKSKDDYTRGRWQVDAHALHRSSGDRLLAPEDFCGVDHAEMFQRFKRWSEESVYDHEAHVALCDAVGSKGMLPSGFMLFQPQSHGEDVWADVARMRTLNTLQAAQERVQHLCPMQFDIARRTIVRFSMPGEVVYDPFAGIGTVPYCAVELGRHGRGTELSPEYFTEAVRYCRAMERKMSVPTLFDLDAGLRNAVNDAPVAAAEPVETEDPAEAEPPTAAAIAVARPSLPTDTHARQADAAAAVSVASLLLSVDGAPWELAVTRLDGESARAWERRCEPYTSALGPGDRARRYDARGRCVWDSATVPVQPAPTAYTSARGTVLAIHDEDMRAPKGVGSLRELHPATGGIGSASGGDNRPWTLTSPVDPGDPRLAVIMERAAQLGARVHRFDDATWAAARESVRAMGEVAEVRPVATAKPKVTRAKKSEAA